MMNGVIIVYSTAATAGVIKARNGKRYYFGKAQWFSSGIEPESGQLVVFKPGDRGAQKVMLNAVCLQKELPFPMVEKQIPRAP